MDKKPNLIMLPGWSTDSRIWKPLEKSLSDQFQLISVDWDDVESIDSFEKKVESALTENQLKRISILGWSLGAIAALDFAAKNPDLVDKLILISATPKFTIDKTSGYQLGWSPKVVERMKKNISACPEKTLLDFYSAMFSDFENGEGKTAEFLSLIKFGEFSPRDIESLATGLDYLISTDLRESIANIQAKSIIIHGEHDNICPVESAEHILELNPRSFKIKRLSGVGHIPFFTATKEVASCIYEFNMEESYDR